MSGTRAYLQKTPTCWKLLSEFQHRDENIRQSDEVMDQSTNMIDDMRRNNKWQICPEELIRIIQSQVNYQTSEIDSDWSVVLT